jgi:histone H3/H4
MEKKKPFDLINVYKLLKKAGIEKFEDSIPSLFLDLIYEFIWEILYKSKIIAKHAGRLNISKIDLEIASKLEFQMLKKNPYLNDKSEFYQNMLNSLPLEEKNEFDFFTSTNLERDFLKTDFKFKF